jgi:Nuclease-related domain
MTTKATTARAAGTYAEQRYRRGLRSWRVKLRPISAVIFGPLIVAGLVGLYLDGHTTSWLAGMLSGLCVGVWMTFREMPPRYVEQWHDGAEGERKTEKALKPLERAGWDIVHDIQRRYGNYDHIAVSRAGVFLLESKNLQGIVELRNGVPHLRRRLDREADTRCDRIRPRALADAARLKEDIEQETGQRTWVQAVVVFWSEFPEGLAEDDKCVFVHGSQLREWMESRPNRLSQANVAEVAAGIAGIAEDAAADNSMEDSQGLSPA